MNMDIIEFVRMSIAIIFTPLSDDVLLATQLGIWNHHGVNPVWMWIASWTVFFVSFSAFYAIGRFFRTIPLLQRFLNGKHLTRAQNFLNRHGKWAIAMSFFTPGLRHPAHYVAGILKFSLIQYLLTTFLAAGAYTGLWTYVMYKVGKIISFKEILNWGMDHSLFLIAGFSTVVIFIIALQRIKKTMISQNQPLTHE
ncbi:DedA family protein [Priestia koreensis]|uniref:DedA family protein n=1 Tax=Priestia koreensis TaxID=284581 RepID=UPI003D039D1D